MTVAQALQTFLESLELGDEEEKVARAQKNHLREQLRDRLSIKRDIITGSFKRHTAVRPLKDIDLFFIFDTKPWGTPREVLDSVKSTVQSACSDLQVSIHPQQKSVNVLFPSGTGYDVVPAFELQKGGYQIPDRVEQVWVETDPEIHEDLCIEANKRAGDMLNRMIKAAKRWNRQQSGGKALSSFLLEVHSYSVFQTKPESFAKGLSQLFETVAERVAFSCPDPAKRGPAIDRSWNPDSRRRAQKLLREAATTANRAVECEARGEEQHAHYLWRSLFGPEYPKGGTNPGPVIAASSSTNRGVDGSNNRFG